MRLAVLFPDADSFHVGMGLELFEQNDAVWEAVREHDRRLTTVLEDALWYGGPDARELGETERATAVLALGVGFYGAFRERYRVPGHVFVGKGVGYLAALVVAGGLELENALRIVRGERARAKWFRRVARDVFEAAGAAPTRDRASMLRTASGLTPGAPVDAAALVERLGEAGADTVLEIGPGTELADAVRPLLPDGVVLGAFDRPRNAHVVLDNLNIGKYFNPRFLAERVLGEIAGTRDRRGTAESRAAVNDLARRVKRLIAEAGLAEDPAPVVSRSDAAVIRTLTRCWMDNGLHKGHTPDEIDAALRALEGELLLPVRRIGGADVHAYAAHRGTGELRRAA
ncbi:MAG TPA: hypothetical protein VGF17_11525 [Phytomonospora sp.]